MNAHRQAIGRRATLGVGFALAATGPGRANDEWPNRPVRIVVAFPPGSSTDVVTRALADRLGRVWPQPVVVENRSGAGGNIATMAVKANNDGHTLLMHSTAFAVNPALYRSAGYVADDFRAIAIVALTPNVLFVHPDVPARTLPELLALAGRQSLAYASSGTGTTPHLGGELLFRALAKVDVLHVSYGPAQAATAVVSGQVPIGFTSLPPALALIRSGAIRAIAVAGAERDPSLPDVPTVAEQGFPGFAASTWFGLFAPVRTVPEAVAERIGAAVAGVLAGAELRERLAALALTDPGLAGAAADAFVRREADTWSQVVRTSGATAE